MKPGILFKNEIKNPLRWIIMSASFIGILLKLQFYNGFLVAYFLSTLLISMGGYKFEKKISFPFIFLGLPILLFVISVFNISFTEQHILFIIPLQIITLGGLIFYYGGYIFEFIWNLNKGFLRKKWNRLNDQLLKIRYKEARFGVIAVALLHVFLAIFSFIGKEYVFAFEQSGIGLLFVILLFWFIKNKKIIKKEAKKIAATDFFMLLIIIIFDSILAQILYLEGNPQWLWIAYGIPFMAFSFILVFINPEHHFLANKSVIRKDDNHQYSS